MLKLNQMTVSKKFLSLITAVYTKPLLLILLPFILGVGLAAAIPQAYQGPIPPIPEGYGKWGDHPVAPPETFQMVSNTFTNTVTLYYPSDQTTPAPTLFFAVGWGVSCEAYAEFLRFFASKGYTAVCDDYGEDVSEIGPQLNELFLEAASRYPNRIDTSQFGLAGHSSGAGLLPSIGYNLIVNHGWGGTDGQNAFIFSAAPWFDFDITDPMLANYPTGVKFILHTYEDDTSTDLRTYIDQFESLTRIPDTEKEYIILRTSSVSGYSYATNHGLIATGGDGYGVFDAMDDYGVFRLADALADYTFNGSAAGKLVALGDGIEQQIEMGELRDLVSTDDPRPIPGASYDYDCDVDYNPRRTYCDDFDNELPASVLLAPTKQIVQADDSPMFSWEPSPTATDYFLQLRPMLPNGDPDWAVSYGESVTAVSANCADGISNCVYTINVSLPSGSYVWWILPSNATTGGVWSRRGYFQKGWQLFLPAIISD
jgi:predicted secreted protein